MKPLLVGVACLAVLLLADAQPALPRSRAQAEGLLRNGVAVYDEARDRVVSFGGYRCMQGNCATVDETWLWNGHTWTQAHPQHSPSLHGVGTRTSDGAGAIAITYDPAHRVVVLVGECCGAAADGTVDTWLWDGEDWRHAQPASRPMMLRDLSLAYDTGHGVAVLWTGNSRVGSVNRPAVAGRLWLWDGNGWTAASDAGTASPPRFGSIVYDAAHGRIVLFTTRYGKNETWLWDGAHWMQETPETVPSPRELALLAYDPAHNTVLLFGGEDPNGLPDANLRADTWLWDGTTWTDVSARAGSPPGISIERYPQLLVYDGVNRMMLLIDEVPLADSPADQWFWNGRTWLTSPGLAPVRLGTAGSGGASHSARTQRTALAFALALAALLLGLACWQRARCMP